MLRQGHVLAVKGLGGYHLAVDATSPAAAARLRARKHREDKPFAVLVPDVAAARMLCELDELAEEMLTSSRRPIVLLPRRAAVPAAATQTGMDGRPGPAARRDHRPDRSRTRSRRATGSWA